MYVSLALFTLPRHRVFKTTTPTAQGKAPLTCPSCNGTRYVIIIIMA